MTGVGVNARSTCALKTKAVAYVLRERESRYRLLADNIADIVILLDRHGNFVFVSHSVAFVLGLDPKILIGRSCFELIHPDDIEAVKTASAELNDPTVTRTAIFRRVSRSAMSSSRSPGRP